MTRPSQEAGIAGIRIDPRDGEVLFANMAFAAVKDLQPKAKKATSSN